MSKTTTRIVFSVLVVLVLVLTAYATVLAASSNVANGGRAFVTAGLLPDVKHLRTSASALNSYEAQSDVYLKSGNGCDEDKYNSPDD